MRKSPLIIFLIILIVLLVVCGGVLILIISAESVTKKFDQGEIPVDFLYIDCPNCNNNPLDIQDCISFLQENKNHPQVIDAANTYGLNLNDIKSVEKKVILKNFQEKTIRCIYHN